MFELADVSENGFWVVTVCVAYFVKHIERIVLLCCNAKAFVVWQFNI